MQEAVHRLADWLVSSQQIVFFGGAGVSTDSGIPDFRSAQGLFVQESADHYSAEEIVSRSFFYRFPKIFFDFYFDKLVYPEVKPNFVHFFLKKWEDKGKELTIITQNIDGLHQLAGSSRVLELHGTVLDNYCTHCGAYYDLRSLPFDDQHIPRCPLDHAIIKPDVVLYEEMLNEETVQKAIAAIASADLMIIGGTSLAVYPAASFINYFKGDKIALINKTALQTYPEKALVFEESLADVFREVDRMVGS